MAVALIACITLKLKLLGLFGSFFLKKYMAQRYKQKRVLVMNQNSF